MKLYLKTRNGADAKATYDPEKKEFVVLKGSVVSKTIANSAKFLGQKRVTEKREGVVDSNNVVVKNVVFKSPSTAANFVTGNSSNGLMTWKDDKGTCLKEILKKE